jgi:hypothetical protein
MWRRNEGEEDMAKDVANYSLENKSAIIYERVCVADTILSS